MRPRLSSISSPRTPAARSQPNWRRLGPIALAVASAWHVAPSLAQDSAATEPAAPHSGSTSDIALPPLTAQRQGSQVSQTTIGGFGNAAGWQQPMQSASFGQRKLQDAQVTQFNDIGKLDASVGNSNAASGYLTALNIRGLALDNFHNVRRDGLPFITEARVALDNIATVEVLKGSSGIQSGMSAPGGLVNLVVKRPQGRIRQADLALTQHGNLLTALDLGDDLVVNPADPQASPRLGLRLNLARERLHPSWQNGQGERHLLALAADTQLSASTRLELELEHARHRQASQPGVSMTGDTLPSARQVSPDLNLNAQPWSQPVRTQNTVGSVRLTHSWDADWEGTLHYGEQHQHADDRDAYGLASVGCLYGMAPCDRFGSDGSYLVTQYESLNESRRTRALDAHVDGQWRTAAWQHRFTTGFSRSLQTRDLPTAQWAFAGVSNIFSPQDVPLNDATSPNPQNSAREASSELYWRDHAQWGEQLHGWLGLRHTRMQRTQSLSDGSQTSHLAEQFTTPWGAIGFSFAPQTLAYASWGEGVEVLPVKFSQPGGRTVVNNGQALPAAKSRQWELGLQGDAPSGLMGQWSLAWFHLVKPEAGLLPVPQTSDVRYGQDGHTRIQGLEAQWHGRWDAYGADMSLMRLHARREGSALAEVNWQAPVNVPDYSVRLSQHYRWAVQRGLTAQLDLLQDGPRTVDLVTQTRLPAWLRGDASLKLAQAWGEQGLVWRLGVRNAFNTRAWRESPTALDHVYVLALAPREWTMSVGISY
jgi:iron complex outermembrane receptor protein